MLLNVEHVIYIDPDTKTLLFLQPLPPLQLEESDWEALIRQLPRRGIDSSIRILGLIDEDLLGI
jgi:hypothetical protein